MSTLKYLDFDGLTTFWEQAKNYIDKGDSNAINSVTYTNANPTTAALGGIAKGETFEEQTIKQMFDMLLYPYVTYSSQRATANVNGGTREVGNQATISTISWSFTKGSVDIQTVKLFSGTSASGSALQEVNPGTATSGTFTLDPAVTTNNNNLQWTVQFDDGQGKPGQSVKTATTGSFTWITPFYHGVCPTDKSAASLTADDIKVMTKDLTAKGTKSYSYTTDNSKACIAYPKSYGTLKKITDSSGVTDYTAAFGTPVEVEMSSTSPAWGPITYYVYTNGNSTASNFGYKFNF